MIKEISENSWEKIDVNLDITNIKAFKATYRCILNLYSRSNLTKMKYRLFFV